MLNIQTIGSTAAFNYASNDLKHHHPGVKGLFGRNFQNKVQVAVNS